MNLFALSGLFISITTLVLIFILLIYGRTRLHKVWILFNIAVFTWGFGCFLASKATSPSSALLGWRIAIFGGLFIGAFFYHTVYVFSGIHKRKTLITIYIQAILYLLLTATTKVTLTNWQVVFNSIYYNRATFVYFLMVMSWVIVVFIGHKELFGFLRKSKGIKHTQARYLLIAFLFGFIGGGPTLLPAFGINLYPIGNFGVAFYALIGTYAILRYRLMDIRVAITRAGIFSIVYTLVLGIPFWIGFKILGKGLWILPISIMAAFATAGPFIYLFFQRKAENRILKEEKRIIQLLMQASSGMTTIRNFKKLLGLIVRLVYKALKINNAAIYLLESNSNQYVLKAARFKYKNPISINSDDPLIQLLKQDSSPLVYEEIKIRADMEGGNHSLREIASQMKGLSASVIVPTTMQDTGYRLQAAGDRLQASSFRIQETGCRRQDTGCKLQAIGGISSNLT